MPWRTRKPAGERSQKDGGFGSAVLHHCLRQQAENAQKHQALLGALKEHGVSKRLSGSSPAGVALSGTISRHRTLEFLAGKLFANPAKGSAQPKHVDQHLRSIVERSELDDYLSTALAAQETFSVNKYEARLLHEPTAPCLVIPKHAGEYKENAIFGVEGGDIRIPRRPVFFSRSMADAVKQVEGKVSIGGSAQSRNRRRRNRARVKLLLGHNVEEATIHNVQFVRQQRDELHRRYQRAKKSYSTKRPARQRGGLIKQGSPCGVASGTGLSDSESIWEPDTPGTAAEASERIEGDEVETSELVRNNDFSFGCSTPTSDSEPLEGGRPKTLCNPEALSPLRPPRTAAELDEVEQDAFLHWKRALAQMEDAGVVLTPFEKNLEVWRQLWRVVEKSDLVLHILDGRSPAFYRCKDLEKYVREVSPTKRVIIVVNKSDLLPAHVRKKWSQHFAAEGVNAVFFSALRELKQQLTEEQRHDGEKREAFELEQTTPSNAQEPLVIDTAYGEAGGAEDILRCESLVKLLERYRDEAMASHFSFHAEGDSEVRNSFVVGTVGYPNVGKSSLINALLGKKKVSVSMQPGKTRRLQTVPLKGRGITLCDCPGLVFPKVVASKHVLVLNGVVPIDEMRGNYLPSIQLVCDQIPRALLWHYGITAGAYQAARKSFICTESSVTFSRTDQQEGSQQKLEAAVVLAVIATQRHFVSGGKGGQLDLYRAAKMILQDFTAGRLLRCHLPDGAIFGEKAEAAGVAEFYSAVLSSLEDRLVKAESSFVLGEPAADLQKARPASGDTGLQLNPTSVLQELEADCDLLDVIGSGEACQITGQQATYITTKRKARQVQKRLQKSKGRSAFKDFYHR